MKSDVIVGEEWHKATLNSEEINRSTARATNDPQFRDIAIELVEGLQLPAFKFEIVSHVKSATNCSDYIALFETLNPSIQYDDKDQIRAAFEVNIPHTGGDEFAVPGRREAEKPVAAKSSASRSAGIKAKDSSIAMIEQFLRGNPNRAYTATEIDALVRPYGIGKLATVMTSLDLRSLVQRGILEFNTVETVHGLEDRFIFKRIKVSA